MSEQAKGAADTTYLVVEVHRSGVRVVVWYGRSKSQAQGVCDRLNRRHSGGLDDRYPIRYEVDTEEADRGA